ncbi:MAG: amino acid permease [Verrucomicrobia bacterium]|nr:amino acid permease [Verrucomicrobiota bacterium]
MKRVDGKLGTFLGVFTPSILTILGVIMYLRFGWVVGQAGLARALVIVAIANSITLVTGLSLSAVATNMRVGVGGAYYIISRSLGLQIGGAIGLPLFLSQTLSVTLYSFGLAESLQFAWKGMTPATVQIVTAGIIVGVTALSLASARFALSAQLPIMVLIGLSLLSLAIGVLVGGPTRPEIHAAPGWPGLWVVFAVFFPAVTGIMAGLGMSGDLRNPQRAIPVGTIAAVLAGFVVYMAVPFVLAIGATRDALLTDNLIWTKLAIVPWIILPAMWGAILSSAVGSILGAPRTLQALAGDRVVPRVFGRAKANGAPPVPAIVLAAGIALGAVLLGDLNTVAPVVTMFFLTTYGMLNLVAGLEKLVGEVSYRPRVRVPGLLSLAGALACFFVMFLINWIACLVAVAVEVGIWLWLRHRALTATWGDVRRGFWLGVARKALVNVRSLPEEPRNWRPNILVFSGNIWKRIDLVKLACQFDVGRGIVTASNLIEGDLDSTEDYGLDVRHREIRAALEGYGLTVFSNVTVVRSFEEGVIDLAQSHGIAGLDSNTIMLGWSSDLERLGAYFRIMRRAARLRKSMLICRLPGPDKLVELDEKRRKRIDIWWRGKQHNGDMMLLLAHLLTLNAEWRGAQICVKSIAVSEIAQGETERGLAALLPEARIQAESKVILKPEDKTILDIMHEESADADLVFMGLADVEAGKEIEYAQRLTDMTAGFPTVVLVKNSSLFVGELV